MHTLELTPAELAMLAEIVAKVSAPAPQARTLADLHDKIVAAHAGA